MEETIPLVNNLVKECTPDASITSILKGLSKQGKIDSQTPREYYRVTELVNPCEAYWKRKRPELDKQPKLRRKLNRGSQLHKNSSYWLKGIDGFTIYEGILDGIHVSLPKVRGKVDYIFNDSILDLKTKSKLPESADEIFDQYPQDIEQVAIYACLYPVKPAENFLLFMEDNPPHCIKAFRLKINDFGRITSLIKDRINRLDKALANDDPSRLGGSRYHNSDVCYLCEAGVCSCNELEPLSIESLKKAIDIVYDEKLTEEIKSLKDSNREIREVYTTWNIIAPKEYYKEKVLNIESDYVQDELKSEYQFCLRNLIDRLEFNASKLEIREVKKNLKESRLLIGQRWVKKISSRNPDGTLVPYIYKVSKNKNRKYISQPNECYIAELGIISSAYKKDSGYIFIVYPHLDDEIIAFEVVFDQPDKILKNTREILDALEVAERDKDDSNLPNTPVWAT